MLSDKTKENLRRKSAYIDQVQIVNGLPLFSWIDINVTELCNRLCEFCPRIDEELFPNQNLSMSIDLAKKIANELKDLEYKGVVVFSGFGEPMMCPHLPETIKLFQDICRIEIITNGDCLKVKKIEEYKQAGIDYFVVSLYDGPEQIKEFEQKFSQAGVSKDDYILRDRWHTAEDGYGLKLTNRAGTIHIGEQVPVDLYKPCYYTTYSLTIDWNGDVLLCMQDWNRKIKFGNVAAESLFDIWGSKKLQNYRNKLINSDRSLYPCKLCNTDGTLHGHKHKDAWLKRQK